MTSGGDAEDKLIVAAVVAEPTSAQTLEVGAPMA
jgi:hypothetical protein